MSFSTTYRKYIRAARKADDYFGFDVRALSRIEPVLAFLFEDWWKVELKGFENIPDEGPALIVGNTSGLIPWTALMLIYAMMRRAVPRKVNIVADMDWIEDERLYARLREIGFVPWSSDNVKRLLSRGELVATFPEGLSGFKKSFSDRYRVGDFDWTRLLSAVEEGVRIFPMSTLGPDESTPVLFNSETLARFLNLPAYPITPFFPWYPFPTNLITLPVKWRMHLLPDSAYAKVTNRDKLEELAKQQSTFLEGEIQAELNRSLRSRLKTKV